MADQSDVETALVALVGGILYPQGAGAPSILGRLARVYRGWPRGGALDGDLAQGHVNVTVFPEPQAPRITTRYPDEFRILATAAPSYTVVATSLEATIGGLPGAGQLVGLLVDAVAVVHRTAASDSPALVAAILAAGFAPHRPALVAGATIGFPGASRIVGRVVADQPAQAETRRQEQRFRISLWCPDPAVRDAAGAAIDAALSPLKFIDLADGTSGRLICQGSTVLDHGENAALYRRDLHIGVEYATTSFAMLPSMIFGDAAFTGGAGGIERHCPG